MNKYSEKPGYDPVTAPVPGVDEKYKKELIEELANQGDPITPSANVNEPERKTVFKFPGGRIVK